VAVLEDAATRRALAATRQAVKKQTREERSDRAGPSGNK
jgi:hypothetical protein